MTKVNKTINSTFQNHINLYFYAGAENLRRVATDAKTRGSVTNILQKTDANLRKLQEELNELHAQVAREYPLFINYNGV